MDLDKEVSSLKERLDVIEQEIKQRKFRTCPRCGGSLRPSTRFDILYCQGDNGLCGRLWTSGKGKGAYFQRSKYDEATLQPNEGRIQYETDVDFWFIAGEQVPREVYEAYGKEPEND
jgi:ribosomal protein S27AE